MRRFFWPVVVLMLSIPSCGDDDKPTTPGDSTAPADVGDLVVVPLGGSSVRLTWSAPGDDGASGSARQYDIRYSSSRMPGGGWPAATPVQDSPEPHIAGTGEVFDVAGLSGADTLFFALRTADEVPNWSGWSNVAGTRLDGVAPAGISDLAATMPADTAVTLTWTAVGDDGSSGRASRYDVRYSTSPTMAWPEMTRLADPPVPKMSGQPESVTVAGLASRTTYTFKVKVGDEVPNWSVESNAVALDPAVPPGEVVDLHMADASPSTLSLRWTATGDDGLTGRAARYILRFAQGRGVPWEGMTAVLDPPRPAVSGAVESYVVSGLTGDTEYSFRIQVGDESGNWSRVSSELIAKTGDTTPPATVTDLVASGVSGTSVSLRWTEPGDNGTQGRITTRQLRYGLAPINESNWSEATEVTALPAIQEPGTVLEKTVVSLEQERTYYFCLRCADEVPNYSALSNLVVATTPDQVPPARVGDLTAVPLTTTSIQLSWTAPGDDGSQGTASLYDIRFATGPWIWENAQAVAAVAAPGAAGTAERLVVTDLREDTRYYFAMKTADEAGSWSLISNITQRRTLDATPPAPVADLTVVSSTATSVTLRWAAPGDNGQTGRATTYDLRFAQSPIDEEQWTTATAAAGEPSPGDPGQEETLTVTGLQPATGYYFALRVGDEVPNWSQLSNGVYGLTGGGGQIRRVPAQYATIQDALDACNPGDTVLLAPGVYSGPRNVDLNVRGKAITVSSEGGRDVTTISCGGSFSTPHRAFLFNSGESATTVIEGVTIRDGYSQGSLPSGCGGGVLCDNGSGPTIRNVRFLSNRASEPAHYETWHEGGAIYCYRGSSPRIEDCEFRNNTAMNGGALSFNGSSPEVRRCVFIENRAIAGAGIYCWYASTTVESSTFAANEADNADPVAASGGSAVFLGDNAGCTILRSVMAFGRRGSAVVVKSAGQTPSITCSDIFGNIGGDWTGRIAGQSGASGNTSVDPLFCGLDTGDVALCSASPCQASASPCGQQVGALGVACDDCQTGTPTWSGHLDSRATSWMSTTTLESGMRYRLVASGQARLSPAHPYRDCEGCEPGGSDCYGPAPPNTPGPGLNHGGIIGRVCGSARNVPCDTVIEATCNGALELIFNDEEGQYGNNDGGFDVLIYRLE